MKYGDDYKGKDKVRTTEASSKETAGNGGQTLPGGPDWMLGKSRSKSGKQGEDRSNWSKPFKGGWQSES